MRTMERDKIHINRNYSWAYTLVFFRNRLVQIWLSKPELAETKATWVDEEPADKVYSEQKRYTQLP